MGPQAAIKFPLTRASRLLLLATFIMVLPVTGCTKDTNQPAQSGDSTLTPTLQTEVLAQIGDTKITLGEFEKTLQNQAPYTQLKLNSAQRRREHLDEMIKFEVLAGEAARLGLDEDPEVIQVTKQAMVHKLMARATGDGSGTEEISDEELEQYYRANQEEFDRPKQVRASHIALSTREEAVNLRAQLEKELTGDENSYRRIFSDFARQHSRDRLTKMRGGDLRYFGEDDQPRGRAGTKVTAPLRKAAFQLETPGALSPPVQSENFWHIVMLTGKREAITRPFEQVKSQIQNRLQQERAQASVTAYIDNLKAQANIKIHDHLLNELDDRIIPEAPARPAAPNARGRGINRALPQGRPTPMERN